MVEFKRLKVWEKAHALTLQVYQATRGFPREERYGLTSQMRRAAASIPANIAEGCCRGGKRDFARFLWNALGSASELEYHVLLAGDLHMIDKTSLDQTTGRVVEIKRMLTGLIRRLTSDV
jgi:four helix bundle protein